MQNNTAGAFGFDYNDVHNTIKQGKGLQIFRFIRVGQF